MNRRQHKDEEQTAELSREDQKTICLLRRLSGLVDDERKLHHQDTMAQEAVSRATFEVIQYILTQFSARELDRLLPNEDGLKRNVQSVLERYIFAHEEFIDGRASQPMTEFLPRHSSPGRPPVELNRAMTRIKAIKYTEYILKHRSKTDKRRVTMQQVFEIASKTLQCGGDHVKAAGLKTFYNSAIGKQQKDKLRNRAQEQVAELIRAIDTLVEDPDVDISKFTYWLDEISQGRNPPCP